MLIARKSFSLFLVSRFLFFFNLVLGLPMSDQAQSEPLLLAPGSPPVQPDPRVGKGNYCGEKQKERLVVVAAAAVVVVWVGGGRNTDKSTILHPHLRFSMQMSPTPTSPVWTTTTCY